MGRHKLLEEEKSKLISVSLKKDLIKYADEAKKKFHTTRSGIIQRALILFREQC